MNQALRWGLFCLLLLTLVGCAASAKSADLGPSGGAYAQSVSAGRSAESVDEVAMMDESASESPPPPPAPSPESATDSAPSASGGAPAPAKARPEADKRPQPPTQQPVAGQSSKPATDGQAKPTVASQMLVYTAELRLRVREVPKAIDAVEKLAKRRGGYLVVREDSRITVRVPSAKFDDALDELVRLGDLVHRNVSIEDVTDLYFDMQTRMKNLEVVKKRLEDLLEKAKTVEESLEVQRELERVTLSLESMRGKLKLLAELVMFSTITVVFEPMSTEHFGSQVRLPFPWMDRLGLGDLLRL